MRRALRTALFTASVALAGAPVAAAFAEEGGAAHEGHAAAACTAEASDKADEECLEYWESHVNWWSLDYKAPYADQTHRHMPPPFGFALINFAVFGLIMYRLAAQPLKDFVRTRHTTIRKDLDEAARLHLEAQQKLDEYQQKISGLEGEIDALLKQVRAEAEVDKARIIAAAEEQAKKLAKDAEAQIAREVEAVRRQLKTETVAQALAVAEKLLTQKLGDADQVRLTERFVGDLEKIAGPNAGALRS